MNTYVTEGRAAQIVESGQTVQYPHANIVPLEPPFDTFMYPDFAGGGINRPSSLVREALALSNIGPSDVLDLGPGFSPTGLYLASLGHTVTVVERDSDVVSWQNAQADELGLNNRFKALVGDAKSSREPEQYDLVVAEMLLHFFNAADIRATLQAMREATRVGGLNVVSVYTENNPEQEKLPPNNRQTLFPVGALPTYYNPQEWSTLHSAEGHANRWVDRGMITLGAYLVPDIAELVVQKTAETTVVQTSWFSSDTSGTATYII